MCDIQAEYYMEQVEWIALDSGPGVEQGLISYLLCLNRYLVKTRTATMDAKAADLFFDICIREMILYWQLKGKKSMIVKIMIETLITIRADYMENF